VQDYVDECQRAVVDLNRLTVDHDLLIGSRIHFEHVVVVGPNYISAQVPVRRDIEPDSLQLLRNTSVLLCHGRLAPWVATGLSNRCVAPGIAV
jgi:hypothetical protein